MKKELFFVEVGVLIPKNDPEFEYYQIENFYDDKFGFYDENKLTYLDYKNAKEYADYYIKNGVKGTYAVVYSGIFNIDDIILEEIVESRYCECSLYNPSNKDTLYFAYKNEDEEKVICIEKEWKDKRNDYFTILSAYEIYKKEFKKEHDKSMTAVCFDEFANNEWQDEEIRNYYLEKIKENKNGKV